MGGLQHHLIFHPSLIRHIVQQTIPDPSFDTSSIAHVTMEDQIIAVNPVRSHMLLVKTKYLPSIQSKYPIWVMNYALKQWPKATKSFSPVPQSLIEQALFKSKSIWCAVGVRGRRFKMIFYDTEKWKQSPIAFWNTHMSSQSPCETNTVT
jgi:hypothetical protein